MPAPACLIAPGDHGLIRQDRREGVGRGRDLLDRTQLRLHPAAVAPAHGVTPSDHTS